MAKPNTLLKRTSNALLDYIKGLPAEPGAFGSESVLARQFGVSRTTVRAAIETMIGSGILERGSAGLRIMRRPKRTDYYSDSETDGPQEQIERVFMQRVLLGDWRPGHTFSEAELARDSNASTVSVREFLFGFSRFGLIAKQPRGGWIMREFHDGFAAEVADMRELIEMAALTRMPRAGSAALTEAADAMIARHRDIEAASVDAPRKASANLRVHRCRMLPSVRPLGAEMFCGPVWEFADRIQNTTACSHTLVTTGFPTPSRRRLCHTLLRSPTFSASLSSLAVYTAAATGAR